MTKTVYEKYLEAEVLSADPVKLVRLLYRGAIGAVRSARSHVAQGNIRERAREINRAWGILQELSGSLDHERGGDISRGLRDLYAYAQTRLIEANVTQSPGPLDEVERILATLSEAWEAATPLPPHTETGAELERAALALG